MGRLHSSKQKPCQRYLFSLLSLLEKQEFEKIQRQALSLVRCSVYSSGGHCSNWNFAGMPPGLTTSHVNSSDHGLHVNNAPVPSESDSAATFNGSSGTMSDDNTSPPPCKCKKTKRMAARADSLDIEAEQTTPRSRSAGVMIANAFQDFVNLKKTSQGAVNNGPDLTMCSAVTLLMDAYGDSLTDQRNCNCC